jgi:hypothetical protein
VLFTLGLLLLVGGIIAAKYGAAIIGLIVAAVNVQPYLGRRKATPDGRMGGAP